MKDLKRALAVALSAGAVLVALAASGVTPARAAGCYGDSCTGRNPVSMGCSATTIDSYRSSTYTINLRYSANCYATWVQLVGTSSSNWGGEINGYTSPSAPFPVVSYVQAPADPSGSYSLMVSFHYYVNVCQAENYAGWETLGCTGRH